jgi:hypothetical protein
VKTTGAGGSKSASVSFAVYGASVITAIAVSPNAAAAAGAVARDVTLSGRGFLPGVTATLLPAGGGAAAPLTVKSSTFSQLVLTATLAPGNAGQLTVTNPGGFASAPQPLNVT